MYDGHERYKFLREMYKRQEMNGLNVCFQSHIIPLLLSMVGWTVSVTSASTIVVTS